MTSNDWRPTATAEALATRARMLGEVRRFFAERGVVEVQTPVLTAATVTDPQIESLAAEVTVADRRRLFLRTSPEYAMKRMLAAGSGSIYEIGPVFRDAEAGARHNTEFTMLEWYRPGLDHHQLMDEVDELVRRILGRPAAERLTYRDAFVRAVDIDPHASPTSEIAQRTRERAGAVTGLADDDRDGWLALLLGMAVGPTLGRGRPTFVFDFPPSQAALARIRSGDPPVAERFELFVGGVELANGYHEERDATVLRTRFEHDRRVRRERGQADIEIDHRLLAAHEAGLPPCAGVALGFDRLVMLATGAGDIADVMPFPVNCA